MQPIKLTNERAWRTYLGGSMIDALHGNRGEDTHFPEEWILSLTAARNAGREHIKNEGMSKLASTGEFLKDVITAEPEKLLGKQHFTRFGADTGVLIKLIDSSERLSIQVHPDKQTAKRLFGSDYGKTECWHILGGRTIDGEPPCIYMGFKEGVTRELWQDIFDRQDIPAMLSCLHKIPVHAGQTFIIPGGVPHAIGAGCFLMEIQEPTDYTVRTERTTPSGFQIDDSMCHQGLGFDKMFDCFRYTGMNEQDNLAAYLVATNGDELVGYDTTNCFRLRSMDVEGCINLPAEDVFSGLYILSGSGEMYCDGQVIQFAAGEQYFVPANCELKLCGKVKLAVMNGPKI